MLKDDIKTLKNETLLSKYRGTFFRYIQETQGYDPKADDTKLDLLEIEREIIGRMTHNDTF